MDNFLKGVGIAVVAVFVLALAAFIGGTILWLIWPVVIPTVLPSLVIGGHLPAELSWWTSVCLAWLCSILFKSTTTVNRSSD